MVEYAQKDSDGQYQVQDVISWFLSKDSMSPKKLQKLLYYAYSWTLTLQNDDLDSLDNRLFDNRFEAWVHGPVMPEVYREFRSFGYSDITRQESQTIKFDDEIEDVLNQVWEEYGHYTGNQLESITHQESPWINARKGYSPLERCNNLIKDEDIFKYYIQQVEYID